MSQLATANGVDLDLKMQLGDLTPEGYRDAVLACTGCSDPEGCSAHLRAGGQGIPAFCRNGDKLKHWSEDAPDLD